MQKECCTTAWGKFCSSLSPLCFLRLPKPLPTRSNSPAAPSSSLFSFSSWPCLLFSAAVSLLTSYLTPSHFFAWIYLYGYLYLNYFFSFWSLLLLFFLPLPSFFPFPPSCIWLFISPITANFLRFSFRPWNGCLRGISSLVWDLCWMRSRHCIFRAVMSSPKVEIAIPKNLAEHASLLSSHLPCGWRDTCVRRGPCPQDRVYAVTAWMPNHCKRGNGLLQGTLWSLRGFLLSCRAVFNVICSAPGSKGTAFLPLSCAAALLALGFGHWFWRVCFLSFL